MKVLVFLQVAFQQGAWKQGWAEAGRITYKATQEHASVEITQPGEDHRLRFRAQKGTRVAISGNSIHLPDSLGWGKSFGSSPVSSGPMNEGNLMAMANGKTERPTPVTVIGWFWKVGGIIGMACALPLALWGHQLLGDYWVGPLETLSPTVLFFWMFATSFIGILTGNGMLKGRIWSRGLAVAYCVIAMLIAGVIYREHPLYWPNLVMNLIFTVVMALFLFLPRATAYFSTPATPTSL